MSHSRLNMPFCFLLQNFAEIGQSVDDLWPKKRFSRWRPPPSWILIFKISIFGHVFVTGFNIWCSVPNFIKIGRFNDFQNGGRPPSSIFSIGSFCHVAFVSMIFCVILQNFAEIRQSVDELWPKRFSTWRPSTILNLKNLILVTWLSSGSIYAVVYQISSKSDDLTIFKMAAVRHLSFRNWQFLSRGLCSEKMLDEISAEITDRRRRRRRLMRVADYYGACHRRQQPRAPPARCRRLGRPV